jgi:hypothetical protein
VIVDKFARIPEQFEIGSSLKRDGANFMISEGASGLSPAGRR